MLYLQNINIAITNFIGTFTVKGQKREQRRAPLHFERKFEKVVPGCTYNEAYHCDAHTLNC